MEKSSEQAGGAKVIIELSQESIQTLRELTSSVNDLTAKLERFEKDGRGYIEEGTTVST